MSRCLRIGPHGSNFAPFSHDFGIISAFLIILVSFWHHFWDIQAAFWHNSYIILYHFGVILGSFLLSFWDHFRIILGRCLVILPWFWHHIGIIFGIIFIEFWNHFWNIFESVWDYFAPIYANFVVILGTF